MNLHTEHARELLGMPPGWEGYKFEVIGENKLVRVVGAVAPLKKRGKYKGHRNWQRLDKTTEKTAYFTPAEHEAWMLEWERKTGLCAECTGRGERSVSWSAAGGTRYKTCDKCGATGKAHNA